MNSRAITSNLVSGLILAGIFSLYLVQDHNEASDSSVQHEAQERGREVMSDRLIAQADFIRPHKSTCLKGI